MIERNAFWLLTAKYLAGEISESEKSTLLELLQSDPLLQEEFEETKKIWQQTPATEPAQDGSLLQRTHQKIIAYEAGQLEAPELPPYAHATTTPELMLPAGREISIRKWMAVAAAVIGISLVAFWFFQGNKTGDTPVQWASVDVPPGKQHKIILPDSSIVYVNAGSHMEYPLSFTDSIREIRLVGEAFFDVTPNASQPFVVESGALRTRVLGTSFNVRAYKNEATQSVLVATGKVQVYTKDKPLDIVLPDHLLTYQLHQQTASVTHQSYGEMNWMQNRMAFNDISFKDLAAELGRRYRKVFVFDNLGLENCRFRALFNNLPVEKILQQLKFTNEFNYINRGDSIYLEGKGCE
jgi:ferric-dicitrate binding protein FerR (iron transport regulator)